MSRRIAVAGLRTTLIATSERERRISVKIAVKRSYVTRRRGDRAVMEQLPYCLHNSRWNSPEFVDQRKRKREIEEGERKRGGNGG